MSTNESVLGRGADIIMESSHQLLRQQSCGAPDQYTWIALDSYQDSDFFPCRKTRRVLTSASGPLRGLALQLLLKCSHSIVQVVSF
jgi:hypothetical protein